MANYAEVFFVIVGDRVKCLLCDVTCIKKLSNAKKHFERFHSIELNYSEEVEKFLKLSNEQCANTDSFDMKLDKLKRSYIVSKNIVLAGYNVIVMASSGKIPVKKFLRTVLAKLVRKLHNVWKKCICLHKQ